MKVSLVLTCAGNGTRAGFGKNKLLIDLGGENSIQKSLSAFYKSGLISEYIVTLSKNDFNEVSLMLPSEVKVVLGGETRTESIKNALKVVTGNIVLIHDGARPFVSNKIISETIESVKKFGSGVVAIPSKDTVLENNNGEIKYLGKSGLYSIQTPQGFFTKDIIKAYEIAGDKTFNDDGEVYFNAFQKLNLVEGSTENIKLTYKEDFEKANLVNAERVGVGFDCHKLVENRKLILGGIEIPFNKGLLGHSDADVLTHAIMDAMLSACAMRDIGYHFPDNDDKYLNANSMNLLKEVVEIIDSAGFRVKNISATIMAQKPKLLNYIPNITQSLATALKLPIENVGIGATTLEGLGFVGREEGICVYATALLYSKKEKYGK